jgi:hypothetical protein
LTPSKSGAPSATAAGRIEPKARAPDMSRRPARATLADLNRAVKAAESASSPMAVEIAPDGTIRIVPALAGADRKAEPKGPPIDIRL